MRVELSPVEASVRSGEKTAVTVKMTNLTSAPMELDMQLGCLAFLSGIVGALLVDVLSRAQVTSHPANTDSAEAVFTALDAALHLPWRQGAFRGAYIFLAWIRMLLRR